MGWFPSPARAASDPERGGVGYRAQFQIAVPATPHPFPLAPRDMRLMWSRAAVQTVEADRAPGAGLVPVRWLLLLGLSGMSLNLLAPDPGALYRLLPFAF